MEVTVNDYPTRHSGGKDDEETLSERISALSEMFPKPLRDFTSKIADVTMGSLKVIYMFTCNATWIFFTSSAILVAPVVFETERTKLKKAESNHRMQLLHGPGAA